MMLPDIAINLEYLTEDEVDLKVEFGTMMHEVELRVGPLQLALSYAVIEKIYQELRPYFVIDEATE